MYIFLLILIVLAFVSNSLSTALATRSASYCLSISILFLVLVANTLASPLPHSPSPTPARQVQLNESLTLAAQNWLQDTQIVSSFLDYAVSTLDNVPPFLLEKAAEALAAELEELSHKSVLDTYFLNNTSPNFNQEVYFANFVLATGGIFQFVVDSLRDIVKTKTGDVRGLRAVVDEIHAARCKWLLPAIDVYFGEVAVEMGKSVFEGAVRPVVCGVDGILP